jgi:predicted lactoylglutathione lyase
MYQRSFEDPDGHAWEPVWMDPKVASGETEPQHIEA